MDLLPSPSADFLASLRPVPNQAPGRQGSRPPPIILGPVAPPPVPMTLGNPLNPPALSFKEAYSCRVLAFCMQSFACTVRANEEGHYVVQAQVLPGRQRRRTQPPWAASRGRVSPTQAASAPTSNKNARAALARAHPGRWGLGHLAASLQTCMVMCEIYRWIGVQVFTILALHCSRLCRKADAGRSTSQVIAGERNHRLCCTPRLNRASLLRQLRQPCPYSHLALTPLAELCFRVRTTQGLHALSAGSKRSSAEAADGAEGELQKKPRAGQWSCRTR